MTDDILGDTLGGGIGLPERPTTDTDDIAVQIRAWYSEAIDSGLWTKYSQEADEDEGYYVGGIKAWSKDYSIADAQALQDSGRPVVAVNHIKPMINLLVGTEVNGRMDVRVLPEGDEDDEDAQLFSQLLHWAADQSDLNESVTEAFKSGLIRGMSLVEVGLDWTESPVDGEIFFRVLKPGKEVVWDPNWKRYDLSDATYIIEFDWKWVDDVIAQYPDKAEEIQRSLEAVFVPMTSAPGVSTDGGTRDAYGNARSHPVETSPDNQRFYDPQLRRVLMCTAWYRAWETDWQVFDSVSGQVETFETETEANTFAKSDAEKLTVKRRNRRVIRTATVLPAGYVTLEKDDSPYSNDRANYPHVPYIADRTGDEIQGEIRDQKDLQRIENKRWSQAIELAQQYANMRQKVEENVLVNPDALRDPADQSVIMVRPGALAKLGWHQPQGLSESVNILQALGNDAKAFMREVGPNVDMLGLKGDASSGIALARRQMQGQTVKAPLFSNLKRTRKLVYQRLARRVQQSFSRERYVRLTNDLGEEMSILVNPLTFKGKSYNKKGLQAAREAAKQANKPRILRDLEMLKYDVRISESPTTPTARAATVEQLIQVIEKWPAAFPLVADVLFELIPDLPRRSTILGRIRRWMQMQGIIETPGAPAGMPGAPSASPAAMGAPGGTPPAPPGLPPGAVPGEVGASVAPLPPGGVPSPLPGMIAAPGVMG